MVTKEILNFYKKTSLYTDLGLYKDFARSLPNDIKELCYLQRHQIIHPFDMKDKEERNNANSFYGDMTKIKETSLCFENDLFGRTQSGGEFSGIYEFLSNCTGGGFLRTRSGCTVNGKSFGI